MDLSALDTAKASDTPAFLHLLHPTTNEPLYDKAADGQQVAVGLMLYGRDSAAWKAHTRAVTNRALQSRRPGRATAEGLEAEALSGIVALTAGWPVPFILNGETLNYSPEAARRLYAAMPWIREQADAFADDRGNFLKG